MRPIFFKPKMTGDREHIFVFDSPERSEFRYRSFVKTYSRQNEETGVLEWNGWYRLRVPHPHMNSHWTMIEVPPNRAYMLDVGYTLGSEMPVILVIDIGPNSVSEFAVEYPDEVWQKMKDSGRIEGMEA